MKRKGLLALAIAPAMMLGIVACDSNPSSTGVSSTQSSSSQTASSDKAPSSSAQTSTPIVSSSSSSSSSSSTVTVTDPYSEPVDAAIADILTKTESELRTLYKVSGVVERITNSEKGIFTLTDSATGQSVAIGGLAADSTFFEGVETGAEPTNPENFASLSLEEGDVLTMIGYVFVQYKSAAPKLIGHYVSHVEKSTVQYDVTVTVKDNVGGTAVADKEKAVYGESVTVTLTPTEGFYARRATINGSGVGIVNNAVTFAAGFNNSVEVIFQEGTAPVFSSTKYTFGDDVVGANTGNVISKEVTTGFFDIFDSNYASGQANVITSITDTSKFYYAEEKGIKLGTGSAEGTFTLNLSEAVTTIVIRATAWHDKAGSVSVNGTEINLANNGDKTNTVYEDLTFTLETPSDTIVISSVVGPRVVISAITLTK